MLRIQGAVSNRVEFYIDDKLHRATYDPNPFTGFYEYTWIETRFGMCTLEVKAWDNADNNASCGKTDLLYLNS